MNHSLMNITIKAAMEAGKYILKIHDYYHKEISTKYNIFIDNISCIIIHILKKAKPKDIFIIQKNKELLNTNSHDNYWIIDPIDDDINFKSNLPCNCITISLIRNKKIELSVIYNPYSNQLFTSVKGYGSQMNGKRIRCNNKRYLYNAIMSIHIDKIYFIKNNIYYNNIINLNKIIYGQRSSGSISLDICFLSCGFIDGVIIFNNIYNSKIISSILIAKESGVIIYEKDNNSINYIILSNNKLGSEIKKIL